MATGVDLAPQAVQVGPFQQGLHRNLLLLRITKAGVAVAEGQVHGLHHRVQAGGPVQAGRRQVKGLKQGQQLQQSEAAARGGHRQHQVAPEAAH